MFHCHLGLIGIHVWRLTAPTATKAKTVVEKVERKRPGRSHPTLLHVDGHDGVCSEMTPKTKNKANVAAQGLLPLVVGKYREYGSAEEVILLSRASVRLGIW